MQAGIKLNTDFLTSSIIPMTYFQGGDHVLLLTTQGKDSGKNWKFQGKILKEYDKYVKGYIYHVQHGTQPPSISLPKQARATCT